MINVDTVYRYHTFIVDYKRYSEENPQCPKLETRKPLFRRSLYTIGLLLKHFNLKDETVRCGLQVSHSLPHHCHYFPHLHYHHFIAHFLKPGAQQYESTLIPIPWNSLEGLAMAGDFICSSFLLLLGMNHSGFHTLLS